MHKLPVPSPRYRWYIVGMLWCISVFNYADRQGVSSVLTLLQEEMGLNNSQLGLVVSSFALVYALGAPFAGAVVDRVRRKTAILAGLQVWSLICAATALSRRFWHLIFFRAAEGLGETFYYPASVSMLSDYHGTATRSRALGIHQTSVYLGTIGGSFFAGLIAEHYGWRSSCVVFGVLGMVLGLVLQRFVHEPPRGAADRDPKALADPVTAGEKTLSFLAVLRLLIGTPTALTLMLAFLCANFVAMVLLGWMPTYLRRELGLSLAMSGLTATLYLQLASMVGAVLGGWLADVLRQRTPGGRILVQAVGVLGGASFVFLCGQTREVGALVVILTAWGLFKGLYDANIFAAAFDVIPAGVRGRTVGVMNMFGWLGGGAGPVVIGFIADRRGLGWAISSAAVVYVAAGALLLLAAFAFVKHDLKATSA